MGARLKGSLNEITKVRLLNAILQSKGTQTSVANILKCHHNAVQKALKRHPDLIPVLADQLVSTDLYITDKLVELCMEGDVRAIDIWKKYKDGVRHKFDVSNGGQPLAIQIISYKDVPDAHVKVNPTT